jgi:RNA polymerase sigma-70 factor (ECF subfamily)
MEPTPDQDQADRLQIEAFVRGEISGFKFIYARHRQHVFSYCLYYMSDRNLAEDAFQEVFARVFTHRDQLREPKALKSWLTMITRSVCLNMLRTSKFTPEFVPVTSSGASVSNNPDGEGMEFKELTIDPREAMQTDDLLKLALSKLSPIYRDAFLLREFEGYSYEEIAEVAGTTVMNIKVRITRAKKRLRELLQPYFGNMGQRPIRHSVADATEREPVPEIRVPQHHDEAHEDEEEIYAR